ncbi:MAG TPA: hypothetical protein PKI03_17630 [Pseudomonadota bacterium]|nr:hypothetical protein [Pseudomonadota bacterium]
MRNENDSIRRLGLGLAVGTLLLGASYVWAVPAPAPASGSTACSGGGAVGTITITDKMIEPASASNAAELKAAQRCSIVKQPEDDGWRINLVAHLNRPPGAEEVNIVFYDLVPKPGPREAVQAYPIRTKRDAKIMLATLEIKPEDGFKVGGKYSVLITRLLNGREDIYARTTLELK